MATKKTVKTTAATSTVVVDSLKLLATIDKLVKSEVYSSRLAFAVKAQVQPAVVYRLEKGNRPSLCNIARICSVLKTPIDTFVRVR